MQNCNLVVHNNTLFLDGLINFDNAKEIMLLGCQFIDNLDKINVNLKDLKTADSSGLAVIIAWIRYARDRNKVINIYDMPKFLLDLGQASGLEQFFNE